MPKRVPHVQGGGGFMHHLDQAAHVAGKSIKSSYNTFSRTSLHSIIFIKGLIDEI